MERLSSSVCMLSLIFYYIGKFIKIKKFNYIKIHIILGTISVISMVGALIERVGQTDFIKYIGFTLIMILVGTTGYFTRKDRRKYKTIHIIIISLFLSIRIF